jgi:hypothetical protein
MLASGAPSRARRRNGAKKQASAWLTKGRMVEGSWRQSIHRKRRPDGLMSDEVIHLVEVLILGTQAHARARARAHAHTLPRPHPHLLSLTPMGMSLSLRLGVSRPTFPREPGSLAPAHLPLLAEFSLSLSPSLSGSLPLSAFRFPPS